MTYIYIYIIDSVLTIYIYIIDSVLTNHPNSGSLKVVDVFPSPKEKEPSSPIIPRLNGYTRTPGPGVSIDSPEKR